ncbi:MAG: hypothetical protein WAM94_15660, partial [Chromatiaceae bacterium]
RRIVKEPRIAGQNSPARHASVCVTSNSYPIVHGSTRMPFQKKHLAVLVGAAFASAAGAGQTVDGPMAFDPIPQSADLLTADCEQPHLVPEGYAMFKVSDETDLNFYGADDGRDPADLTDMNTVNETGLRERPPPHRRLRVGGTEPG